MSDYCGICGVLATWDWWVSVGRPQKSCHLCISCYTAGNINNDDTKEVNKTAYQKRDVIRKIKLYGKTQRCWRYCHSGV